MKVLDQPWKDWVRLNVARGCLREELLGILLREGFDEEAARLEAFRTPLRIPNLQPVESPRLEIYTAERFLTREHCAALMARMRGSAPTLLDSAIREADAKICAALGADPAAAEPLRAQVYEVGEAFKPPAGRPTWTVMVHLNEPAGGGETLFPDIGLVLRPKSGLAVIWNSLLPDGTPNRYGRLHGRPVTAGRKAILTKWLRRPATLSRAAPPPRR